MMQNDATRVVTHVVSGDLWAGAEVQVYNLCEALLTSNQVLPTAVVFNDGILHEKLQKLGIPVTLADETRLGPIAIARAIAAHCREHRTGIVHTHGFKENVLGILGKELAGVPASVRTVHGNPETAFTLKRPHKWLIQKLDVMLGRLRQQAIIAVSTQLEERLEKLFPGKVHKIFNFIDVDNIRRQWKRRAETNAERPRIGIVGRLVPVKRIDIFLKTIALLNQQGLECEGVVIGGGPMEAELKQLANELGIADKIAFMGFVSPPAAEMTKLDVLLMPSDHEGLPMTLLEALALEVPVVSHDVGGIPEVLGNGGCGWLVKDHSPEGYTRALKQVFTEVTDREQKSVSGLMQVRSIFGVGANSRKYAEVYNNI
ncbi:Glycosyltransferase involved in cell wall bisynthesis [Marinobacter sp. es.042]|uniref:glycosyltransferase n=1 Tax=Marinobacter sp. es.042 TaxID=1761794 RepID=UPI000B5057D7|nr:glycosyltransferase [Marinobacter sp. es.042]SNB55496.1 Glycosyltransferase involved in cell wall bisynthesis [Marinobacter sp. es.042]